MAGCQDLRQYLTPIPIVCDEDTLPVTPDPETGGFQPDLWGGEVHIPYEGALYADLWIVPSWHRNLVMTGPEARFPKMCNVLVTNRDFGEVAGAERERAANCWVYRSTAPYRDCSPLTESREIQRRIAARIIRMPNPQ